MPIGIVFSWATPNDLQTRVCAIYWPEPAGNLQTSPRCCRPVSSMNDKTSCTNNIGIQATQLMLVSGFRTGISAQYSAGIPDLRQAFRIRSRLIFLLLELLAHCAKSSTPLAPALVASFQEIAVSVADILFFKNNEDKCRR